ncbi:MAG: sulfite exporter TauE/SafE family protein [Acidobacteriota bacterium]
MTPALDSFSPLQFFAVFGVGMVSGFFNVTAGGGSFFSVPLLIVLGFPAAVANGTNRVALVVQNLTAIPQFRHGGVNRMRLALPIALAALPSALLGAWLAVLIPELTFRKLLGGLMIAMTAVVLLSPKGGTVEPELGHRYRWLTLLSFFGIGAYGGLIQAGVGFPIVFALAGLERFTLVRSHAYKIIVVLAIQLAALPIFIGSEAIDLSAAVVLSVAYALGGWVGAKVVLQSGDRTLRIIFAVSALLLALKMLLG